MKLFKCLIFTSFFISSYAFSIGGTYHNGVCETDVAPYEFDCCASNVNCPSGSSDGDDCDVMLNGIRHPGIVSRLAELRKEKVGRCTNTNLNDRELLIKMSR